MKDVYFSIFNGNVFVHLTIKPFKQTRPLLFKNLLLYPVSSELKLINFCRILAKGSGHRKGLKYLK